MNIKYLIGILKQLIVQPTVFWEDQKDVSYNKALIFNKFAYKLIVLAALSAFIGNLLAISTTEYSFLYIIVLVLALLFTLIICLFANILLIKELVIKYNGDSNIDNIRRVVVYSMSVYWAALIVGGFLANHGPMRNFIEFLGLYGAYVYFRGIFLLNIKKDDRIVFTFLSLVIVVLVYLFTYWAVGFIPTVIKTLSI